ERGPTVAQGGPTCSCSSSSRLSSPDQSTNPRHSPCRSRLPARISDSIAAISRGARTIASGPLGNTGSCAGVIRWPPFLRDLFERAAVPIQGCLLAAQLFPPLNDDIHVLRVQLQPTAGSLS